MPEKKEGPKYGVRCTPMQRGGTMAATDIITESGMAQMNITYSDVSNLDGTRWDKAMYDDIRKNDPGRMILIFNNKPEDMLNGWLSQA